MTRLVKLGNNAVSVLAANLLVGGTSFGVTPGTGSKFPTITGSQYFMATLVKSDGTTEVVKVTGRASDTFTIVRAAEAVAGVQTAYAFSTGDRVEHRLTAGALGGELDRLDNAALVSAANKSAAYSVLEADVASLIRVNTAAGSIPITLPLISTLADDFDIIVAKVSSDVNPAVVTASGSDTVNGLATYQVSKQWQSAWLIADRSTNTWTAINSSASGADAVVDTFVGSGTPGPFTLLGDPGSKNNTEVFVGGVYQQKSTYTLSGTSLTLGGNVSAGVPVEVNWGQPRDIGTPSDNTVSTAKVQNGAITIVKTSGVAALSTKDNWNTAGSATQVAGMLGWKHLGDGRVIFDASSSVTPNGGACSNTDPTNPWIPTFPTLMGMSLAGTTYGVRVDVARYAENALGVGQTWQNFTGSRALNTNYTNSTGRSIIVAVTGVQTVGGGRVIGLIVSSLFVDEDVTASASINDQVTVTGIVPAGAVYQVQASGINASPGWIELR